MFLTRQVQVKEKYVAQSKYLFDHPINDFSKKSVVIDGSNTQIETYIPPNLTYKNFKYDTMIDEYDEQRDVIIVNPYVFENLKCSDREIIEKFCPLLPIEQRYFLNDEEQNLTQEQVLLKIYTTVLNQLTEEKDILIYCADGNEIEYFRILFDPYPIRLIIKIDKYFDELSLQMISNSKYYTNTIYLLLEPQQLENANITLIVHTFQREIIHRRDDNVVEYSYQSLSLVDLQVREISKSNSEAVMVYYGFTEQQYFQLASKPQSSTDVDSQSEHFEKLLVQFDKQEISKNKIKFAILIANLFTTGQMLSPYNLNNLNKQLNIKASQYWSRLGDYQSWYNITLQIVSIINNSIENKVQQLLKKFSSEHKVNLTKALQVISKLKYFANLYEIDELNLIDELQPLELIKQSSSMDQFQTENEDSLKQLFPLQKDYEIHKTSLQKIFKLNNLPCYILGVRGEQVLYSVIAESLQRKASMQEHLIQNVCSAAMDQLWSGEESAIQKLETKFKCQIEPFNNNNIIIYGDNSKQVEQELLSQISRIKEELKNQTKDYVYLNSNVKFVLTNGASIQKCYFCHDSIIEISNLSHETTEKDLRNLIEPYSKVNSISFTKQRTTKKALVDLMDREAVHEVIQDFDETEFQDQIIRVNSSTEQISTQRKFHSYILKLQWFIYNCKGSAEVKFGSSESANQFFNQFHKTILDGQQMNFQRIDETTILITNLNQYVTELDIQKLSKTIKEITMQKSVLYEPKYDIFQKVEQMLQDETRRFSFVGKHSQIIRISNSKKDYKRTLKLSVHSIDMVNSALSNFNNSLIQIGLQQVKLYCQAQYRREFLIKQDLIKFVKNNIQSIQQKYQNMFQIEQIESSNSDYTLLLKSSDYLVYTKVGESIQNIVEGYLVNFGELNNILLSDFGRQYLQEIEMTQNAIFNIDKAKKIIKVYCLDEKFQELQDEIKIFLEKNTTITITLTPQKLKQLIGIDSQGLQYLLEKHQLTEIIPLRKTNSLKLSGQAAKLEQAVQQIQAFLQSQNDCLNQKQSESNQSSDLNCSYCLMYMQQPYILTNCNHKLCTECLNFDFSNSIKDVNSLPIKCPICQDPVLLEDIINIIGDTKYQKLVEMSINKYISDNREQLVFCFSQGCSNILQIKGPTAFCDVCRNNFCVKCKVQMHYGMTCWEYKVGDQKIMEELMKKEDIRFCPNCRSLAQKISGCMSVLCSGCKKYICWKNGKNDQPCMKIFSNSRECHIHLTDVHGGYY